MDRNQSSNQIDMLHGPLAKKILLMALPLAASSILQQLFNSADVAVAGRFAGSQALAAVGSNGSLITLFVNFFVGLSIGANVVIANFIGQKKLNQIHDVVHTVILFALIMGVAFVFVGQVIARPLLQFIDTPEDVLDLAVRYLRLYFIGMPFIALYNYGAAILRSIGDTKRPLYALIISGVINVCLNLLLVIVFRMGVAGVAVATVIANGISTTIILRALMQEKSEIRLNWRELRFEKRYMWMTVKVGAPAALQSMVFSFSNVCIQTGINSFGSAAVAGSSTGLNFESFTYFMVNSFAQATVTFTSQNFGAGSCDRCKRVYVLAMVEGVLLTSCMSAVFTIWGTPLVRLYTLDPEVIRFALTRMHHVMIIECLTASYEISGAALRGIGHSMLPALLTMIGSVGFRLVWLSTVFRRFHSFDMLMNVYPVSWVLTGTMVITAYFLIRRKEFRERM